LPEAPDWTEPRPIDPVFLFRFSALTFNGHRIHYDLAYAIEVEKYPGLVVHGPLQALLLIEAAQRHAPGRRVSRFSFRAIRPLFGHDTVMLAGKGDKVFTANGEGAIGMQATVTFAD
jgi:3-methylfumaryl-CoA hydratase